MRTYELPGTGVAPADRPPRRRPALRAGPRGPRVRRRRRAGRASASAHAPTAAGRAGSPSAAGPARSPSTPSTTGSRCWRPHGPDRRRATSPPGAAGSESRHRLRQVRHAVRRVRHRAGAGRAHDVRRRAEAARGASTPPPPPATPPSSSPWPISTCPSPCCHPDLPPTSGRQALTQQDVGTDRPARRSVGVGAVVSLRPLPAARRARAPLDADPAGAVASSSQHGALTPYAPPLPPGAHLLAWSDADADFWTHRADRRRARGRRQPAALAARVEPSDRTPRRRRAAR